MWTIFNLSVLKDIINVFLFYISFKLTWSATGRRLVGDQSPTGRRPVASSRKEVPTRSPTSRRSVGNQSPISRRPTAKPSCDSSATSAIVLNFGRGEVAERLQCMSDLGLKQHLLDKWLSKYNKNKHSFCTFKIVFNCNMSVLIHCIMCYWC